MFKRTIDRKYHIDEHGEIVKTSNGVPVPADKPLILFRGRDRLALPMLRSYRQICVDDGCNDYQISAIDKVIESFEQFATQHPSTMKQPGCTMGK